MECGIDFAFGLEAMTGIGASEQEQEPGMLPMFTAVGCRLTRAFGAVRQLEFWAHACVSLLM
jgi:hypothetical protein